MARRAAFSATLASLRASNPQASTSFADLRMVVVGQFWYIAQDARS